MKSSDRRSFAKVFEEVFGCKGVECKPRKLSKKQQRRNIELQKAVSDFVKMLEAAHEATKGSTLKFD